MRNEDVNVNDEGIEEMTSPSEITNLSEMDISLVFSDIRNTLICLDLLSKHILRPLVCFYMKIINRNKSNGSNRFEELKYIVV